MIDQAIFRIRQKKGKIDSQSKKGPLEALVWSAPIKGSGPKEKKRKKAHFIEEKTFSFAFKASHSPEREKCSPEKKTFLKFKKR